MRIKEKVANIDYSETRQFFKNRAQKFQEHNPYCNDITSVPISSDKIYQLLI